jgi:hypothetical protein
MSALPVASPVTIPVVVVAVETVATETSVELQLRPAEADVSVAELPTHIMLTPVMVDGSALTVIASVRLHPLLRV